tara:strand:- start:853 stop:2667 length:1815 start_codon:yes stop_codon:yes gene_type:complete
MSEIRVNTVVAAEGLSAPNLPYGIQVPTGMGITGAGGLNITGVATAGSFVGNITGNVTGNATGLTGTPNISCGTIAGSTGTFSGAVNVDATTDSTSATSGALIVDGGLGVAKNVYIGAGLSVAGTLTYEDVTNVDSVGLITAKSGVNISGGQLVVGVAYSVGAAGVATAAGFVGPLTGAVTGNADTATTATNVNASANNSNNETVYPLFVDGATGSQGCETDTGLTYNPSSGNLGIGGELAAASLDISGSADIDGTMEADAITVNGTALNTVIAGVTVTNATTAANVTVADESSDTTCFPTFVTAATGDLAPKSGSNLTFNSSTGALTAGSFVGNIAGDVTGNLNGTVNTGAQGSITSLGTLTGLTVSGDVLFDNGEDAGKDLLWDVSQDALIHKDSVYASWGTDQDMSIWFDGSNSYIQNTTGTLNIRPKSGENGIVLTADGAVTLYYDNVQKLRTTGDGTVVTGVSTVTAGAHFAGMLREDCKIVANKLSADTNIDLEDGMIHYYSTNETTTATPNIRWNSSYSLNNKMSIGQTVSVTIIYKPNGAGYYAALNVDGSGVTEEWNGGTAPSSAESGGYDVLTHTLVKTADATFLCLSSTNNFA